MKNFWKGLGHAAVSGAVSGISLVFIGGVSGWKQIASGVAAAALTGVASYLRPAPGQALAK